MNDADLLEEYSKEIMGKYYNSDSDKMTVARLIESHRNLRNLNIERNGVFDEARKEGYKHGYEYATEIHKDEINLLREELKKLGKVL